MSKLKGLNFKTCSKYNSNRVTSNDKAKELIKISKRFLKYSTNKIL